MNKLLLKLHLPLSLLLLAGCTSKGSERESIVSMQVVDRNGFSETISNQDRLGIYQNVDFLTAQPYEKVLRVFKKDKEGKSPSKLTSYHDNGGIWQYLEAVDGRAHGRFLEWHPNGKLKIEGRIIEGKADLSELAQQNWLFDGKCSVWDEDGNLEAEFEYSKGHLEGTARYYYPDGTIQKIIPYVHDNIDGALEIFSSNGQVLETIHFKNGVHDGTATGQWNNTLSKYQEHYRDGLLIYGIYFDSEGTSIAEIENGYGMKAIFEGDALAQLIQYENGAIDGKIKCFTPDGLLDTVYTVKNGQKTGEEWHYYPSSTEDMPSPKLMVTWNNDRIEGMVKTWYENGVLESQREMNGNKKHGLSFAYYLSGDLMLMEEYENDLLVDGSYYKKGDAEPVSKIEKGDGIATVYTKEGNFQSKITYERGKPVIK